MPVPEGAPRVDPEPGPAPRHPGYPEPPWHLRGHMTVFLWLVPTALVADRVPRGTRPVSVAGRPVVVVQLQDLRITFGVDGER